MAQKITTITISNGQTDSAEITLHGANGARALTLNFISPASLPETVNIELGDGASGNYGRLQSGGTDITLSAGKCTVVDSIVAVTLKLVATGAVAADRTFQMVQAQRAYE